MNTTGNIMKNWKEHLKCKKVKQSQTQPVVPSNENSKTKYVVETLRVYQTQTCMQRFTP
jgi:hypothetical protein